MEYIEARSILSKLRQTDSMFGLTYNMNLYRGCQHGCIYCDTRSECYGVGDISKIVLKKNALELLTAELRAKRGKKGTIGTGSMNDPYMPVEKEVMMVNRALQIIAREKFPVHIITKSDLVLRDVDILQEISATYAAVSFTITTADDDLAARLEPGASSTTRRFAALKALAQKGIYVGITLMPVLPFINDTPENIAAILKRAKDCGASYAIPMFGTTLRKGSRDYFYGALDREFPGMKQKYSVAFGDQYECYSPRYKELEAVFKSGGLPRRMDFYKQDIPEQLSLFG